MRKQSDIQCWITRDIKIFTKITCIITSRKKCTHTKTDFSNLYLESQGTEYQNLFTITPKNDNDQDTHRNILDSI